MIITFTGSVVHLKEDAIIIRIQPEQGFVPAFGIPSALNGDFVLIGTDEEKQELRKLEGMRIVFEAHITNFGPNNLALVLDGRRIVGLAPEEEEVEEEPEAQKIVRNTITKLQGVVTELRNVLDAASD